MITFVVIFFGVFVPIVFLFAMFGIKSVSTGLLMIVTFSVLVNMGLELLEDRKEEKNGQDKQT
jgi:predicted outer membrane lipoprotein